MKRIYLSLLLIMLLLIPNSINALTEDQARKAITDYTYYIYNQKKSEISYVNPSEVNQERIFLGYKTQNNTYAMDCNAFVGFVIYNAFQLNANPNGSIEQPANGDGYLNYSGRAALNGVNGWSSHSSLYDSNSYALRAGETVQEAVSRINLESKLKPGDLIGIVGFSSSSYNTLEEANKSTHIMIYVGDGKYIHNRSSGVSLDKLTSISYGNRVGSTFPDGKGNMGPHGAITVLTLINYDKISSSVLEGYRYPDGNGKLVVTKTNQSSSSSTSSSTKTNKNKESGHWEHVTERIHFCQREDTAKLVRLFDLFIQIIGVAVPILLIISLMIGFAKALTNPDNFKVVKKTVVTKSVAAVLIFLIPTFISIITNISGLEVNYSKCLEMAHDPKQVYIWVEDPPEKEDNFKVEKTGIYVKVSAKDVTGYYFSDKKENLKLSDSVWIESNKNSVDFVLLPGTHYIYVKTKNENIHEKKLEVKTSDIIVTNNVKDIKLLTTSLDDFLKQQKSSLEEFNEAIARSVYIAGGNTKAGASAASLALTQILYIKYKVKIPYGNTHGTHIVMGAPASWGSPNITSLERQGKFYNQGIHCGGFVAWAYAQANFDMNPGIGSSATLCRWRYADIEYITGGNRGDIGDAITYALECDQSSHVAIINAIDSKGYYITESNAATRTIDGVKTLLDNIGIVTTYNKFGDRWRSYLDMNLTLRFRKKDTKLKTGL